MNAESVFVVVGAIAVEKVREAAAPGLTVIVEEQAVFAPKAARRDLTEVFTVWTFVKVPVPLAAVTGSKGS